MKFLDYIQGYRKGQEANEIEKKSLGDSFLYDAIDGYDAIEGNHLQHIAEMQTRVKNKHLPTKSKRILRIITAAVVFFAIVSGYLFISEENNNNHNLTAYLDITAEKNSVETQVAVAEKTEDLVPFEEPAAEELATQTAPIIDDVLLDSKLDYESRTSDNEKKDVHITSSVKEEKNITGLAEKIITQDQLKQISADQAISRGLEVAENISSKNMNQKNLSREIQRDEIVVSPSIKEKAKSEDTDPNPNGNWFVGAGASATMYTGSTDNHASLTDRMTVRQNSSRGSAAQLYMEQANDHVGFTDKIIVSENKSAKASISQEAIPIIGQQNYNKYLRKNIKYPKDGTCSNVKGSVILEFNITKTGRPINIRVAKSLCFQLDQEAIRLVRSGSDWTTSNTSVHLLIEFDGSKNDK